MHIPNLILIRFLLICKNSQYPIIFFGDNKIEDFDKYYDTIEKSEKLEILAKISEDLK